MKDQSCKLLIKLARIKQFELDLIFEKEGWDYLRIFRRPYWLPKTSIEWKECKKYFMVNGIRFPIRQNKMWHQDSNPPIFSYGLTVVICPKNYSPYCVQKEFGFDMGMEVGIDTFRNTLIELEKNSKI